MTKIKPFIRYLGSFTDFVQLIWSVTKQLRCTYSSVPLPESIFYEIITHFEADDKIPVKQ